MTQTEKNQEFEQLPDHQAEPFMVYREGEVDQEWLAEQKRIERINKIKRVGNTILNASQTRVQALGQAIGHSIGELMDEWDARAYDSRHGTNFAQQLAQKRRQDRNALMARRLGLG